jgi:ATP/maltotriose-dependent transcriptional regulator MalT
VAASVRATSDAIELGREALAHLPTPHPLRGITAAGLSFACFDAGDLAGASAAVQAGRAPIGQHSQVVILVALDALHATVLRAQGRLRDARRSAAEVLERATINGRTLPTHGGFLAHLQLALIDYEQNDLDAAAATIERCAQLAQQHHVPLYAAMAQAYHAHVLAARGSMRRPMG